MTIKSRIAAFSAAAVVALSSLVVTEGTAQASIPTSYCNGKSYVSVVNTYHRGNSAYPLRCGNSRWGFLHVTARWNPSFEYYIALTISRGETATDYQQDGGSQIFALFDNSCNELFRVIYNGGAYNGNGVRPQGIITAYYISHGGPVAVRQSVGAVTPNYGTTCPIIQNI